MITPTVEHIGEPGPHIRPAVAPPAAPPAIPPPMVIPCLYVSFSLFSAL